MRAHTIQVQLQNALRTLATEVIDYPARRPHSSDSHLPRHLVEMAAPALGAAGADVASHPVKGGAV